jgi:hypothetical protein
VDSRPDPRHPQPPDVRPPGKPIPDMNPPGQDEAEEPPAGDQRLSVG